MFQRRVDGNEDFYRDWKEYEFGFGNKSYDHWLGEHSMEHFLLLFTLKVSMWGGDGDRGKRGSER